ncbi:hypothetical protein DSECCO2_12990 [anaerobic digester metagenome]
MGRNQLFSERLGIVSSKISLNLDQIKKMFVTQYKNFLDAGYFSEALGKYHGPFRKNGYLGDDIELALLHTFRRNIPWPPDLHIKEYSENDLFDIIEFLHCHIRKPYQRFDYEESEENRASEGKKEYVDAINSILSDYGDGYQLSESGFIEYLPSAGFQDLMQQEPQTDDELIKAKLKAATEKYLRSRSSTEEMKHAIKELADILEFLRPQIKEMPISKDENELFMIANQYGIRHFNPSIKTDYDNEIWYEWFFISFLNAIHLTFKYLAQKPG